MIKRCTKQPNAHAAVYFTSQRLHGSVFWRDRPSGLFLFPKIRKILTLRNEGYNKKGKYLRKAVIRMTLQCSAKISNEAERNAIVAWLNTLSESECSVDGETVSITTQLDIDEPDSGRRKWALINVFEEYAEHSIVQN